MATTYTELSQKVREMGLLNRQYGYYTLKFISSIGLTLFFGALLLLAPMWWLKALAFFGFIVFTIQIAGLAHDAGHRAIFKSSAWNTTWGHIFANLFLGFSIFYWVDKHNRHHANPNHEEDDPDFNAGFVLSKDAMEKKRGLMRHYAKRQHHLYFPVLGILMYVMTVQSYIFNFKLKSSLRKWSEIIMMTANIAIVWVTPLFFFPWWQALLLSALYKYLTSMYFGSIVASNHKGMETLKKGVEYDFAHKQIVTTRNVRGNPINDFIFVGINYQIEHHLFPTMPRNNFKKCQQMVRDFCAARGLPYTETGVIEGYRDIISELREIAQHKPVSA